MAETETIDYAKEKTPHFRIGNAGIFRTGLVSYGPGEVIEWKVPEGWNEKKYGKHFASYGPSISWEPLNPAAEKLMEEHKANVKKKNTPKASEIEVLQSLVTKQSEM